MKRSYSLCLLLAALMLPQTATAYDFIEGGICYNINSDGASVTVTYERTTSPRYSNANGSLTIPPSVTHNGTTYAVTSIGDYAFRGCSGFTGSLTIPNSVTSIGDWAFCSCSGFTGSLTIPKSVTSIGSGAFDGCCGFTGSLVIPNSVTSIGNWAFCSCSGFTGSLIIPNSVTEIGIYAFSGCSGFTGSLIIPRTVTSIGGGAFGNCLGIETLTVASDNPKYDSRDNCNAIIETATNTMIGGIKNFSIPNSVTTIGERAFAGCRGFTGSLNIPNSVTEIGNYAFYYCSGFTGSLNIPNSVTSIGDWAFEYCDGFTDALTIPNSVITIGNYAFYYCSGFTGSLFIPNSVTSIGSFAFYHCSGFTGSLTIGNSVTEIGIYAFQNCCGFTGSLTIPNSIAVIGHDAFAGCVGFTDSLTIPNSVNYIDGSAFADCSGLTSVTIPNSVTHIYGNPFSGCSGLKTLTLTGNGSWSQWPLKGINISQIKTLNVGSGVTELGGLEFTPDVVNSYAEAPPTCAETTFTNYDAALHVPSSSTVAYITAPYWTNFGNIVNDVKEKMSIDQTEANMTVSEKLQLKATATPSSMNNEIMWCSSNPTVAKVDENGLVTSVSPGECDIFAYLSSVPAVYSSCHISSESEIALDVTKATITPNQILTLTPNYDSTKTDITATSSDTDVAIARVVKIDGVKKVQVVGVALGTATITVAGTNETYRPATCVVTVAAQRSGDVNGDGKVDVEDVNAAINIILELKTEADYAGCVDMNGDGKVDVEDVNAVINIILAN